MSTITYDQVEEGDELSPVTRFVSKDDVRTYARVNRTEYPRFMDDDGAREEGLPGMIVPGNMSMGLVSTFLESWAGAGGLRRLGTTFRGLVLPDNDVTLNAVVTQKDDGSRAVELDVWMESHEGERLVIGTATVRLS
jgi:acyl dehydratase